MLPLTNNLIATWVGIPANNPISQLPKYKQDRDVLVLEREPEAIPWRYTIRAAVHEVIVLDTLTWRGYSTGTESGLEPPLDSKPEHIKATLVVLPTNLVALGIIDRIQQYELSRDRIFSTDMGDSWNFHETLLSPGCLTSVNSASG
ncbi:MAG: hypothetical protein AAFQ41_02790 [Cyanobacteria bacterium J06623_7]